MALVMTAFRVETTSLLLRLAGIRKKERRSVLVHSEGADHLLGRGGQHELGEGRGARAFTLGNLPGSTSMTW